MKTKIVSMAALAATVLLSGPISSHAQSWSLTGNAGTTSANFIGTTDSKALRFRTNNRVRMYLNHKGFLGVGQTKPKYRIDAKGNNSDSVFVVNSLVTFSGEFDAIAVNGVSQPSPGWGIGVSGLGNFIGTQGIGSIGVWGNGVAVGVQGESSGPDTTSFTGDLTGVVGITSMGAASIGVYGEAEEANFNYGVFGVATDTASSPDYALVGVGDVYGWRYFVPSDRKLKKEIAPFTGALDRLSQLTTSVYAFATEQYAGYRLPGGSHVGFMADEVNKIFPELIKHGGIPAGRTKEARGKGKVNVIPDVMAVNYTGFVPVLAQAIIEQKAIVDQKDTEIAELKTRLADIEARLAAMEQTSSARLTNSAGTGLEQNQPNPFSEATEINYHVPSGANNARITISDANGKVVRTYKLSGRAQGTVTINAGTLAAGSYTYSLVVDGNVTDTKLMLLTR